MNPERQLERLALTLRQLLLAAFGMHPDDLARQVADACVHLGGTETVLLLCDYDQEVLVPFDADDAREYLIDDSSPGEAFRTDSIVAGSRGDGRRQLWVPVKDSAEREGVLGVVDDGSVANENWLTVASLVGELVTSKEEYGDHITRRKRRSPFTIPAEMRWALMPPLTYSSPDVTIAAFVHPSDRIAGDAFDYAVTGRTAAVAVFDAMGHGLEASRMANLAVGASRNSRRNGADLIETLRAVDTAIADQFGDSTFVTAQLAALDLDSGRMEIANAGHPRPLLLRRGHPVAEVPCEPSEPAGLGGEPTLMTLELARGDSVLFRTDGVVDARSPDGEVFSDARLAELVHGLTDAGMPPSEVLRRAVHSVARHRAQRPGDDATLLQVCWRVLEVPSP